MSERSIIYYVYTHVHIKNVLTKTKMRRVSLSHCGTTQTITGKQ